MTAVHISAPSVPESDAAAWPSQGRGGSEEGVEEGLQGAEPKFPAADEVSEEKCNCLDDTMFLGPRFRAREKERSGSHALLFLRDRSGMSREHP